METSIQSAGDVTEAIRSAPVPLPVPAQRGGVVASRDGTVTIGALIDSYMSQYAGKDPTRLQRLTFWVAKLGPVKLSELTDDSVFYALEELADRQGRYFAGNDADGQKVFRAKRKVLAPATINRYAAALGAVLTWAIKKRIAPRDFVNPVKRIERRAEDNEVVRFLSDDERIALLAAARVSSWKKLYLLVLLGLTTGARRGELGRMCWRDIDFDRGQISVTVTKNGDAKVLPLTPPVIEELRKHVSAPSTLVFASKRRPDSTFNSEPVWQKALKTAGVRNFRFHDLRHSCASTLAQSGATLLEIADVLGHRQLSVTKRYSHLTVKNKSDLIHRVLGEIQ